MMLKQVDDKSITPSFGKGALAVSKGRVAAQTFGSDPVRLLLSSVRANFFAVKTIIGDMKKMTLNSSIGLSAAMLSVLLVGCGEKEPAAPAAAAPQAVEKMTAAQERMNDPEYVKQLDALMEKKKECLSKMNKAREALAKAEAEGVGEGKIAELKAAVERAVKNFKACENEARQVVSRRMQASIVKTNGSQEGK